MDLTGLARMPEGSWDSHIHVVDPLRYPLAAHAAYTPGIYTAWDNVVFETSLGAAHNTIVQPSIYGYDNRAVLEALQAYGPGRARAVVDFDPEVTSLETLRKWHALGVRGVRVNLGFVAQMPTASAFRATLRSYADAVRPLGWALQLYIPLALIAELEDDWPTLDVAVVFDHFGHPTLPKGPNGQTMTEYDPYSVDGFASLVRLLQGGRAWVKISAPCRLCSTDGAPSYPALDPLIKELLQKAPTRLVYAPDWPHTLFEGLDIRPWTNHVLDLTGEDEELRARLFRDNAKRLWDFEPTRRDSVSRWSDRMNRMDRMDRNDIPIGH